MWAGVHHTLRSDVTAGVLLLAATVTALVLANSSTATIYERVRDYTIGPEALHLHLTLGQWAADGWLAIFFFVVGLELKEEFVVGKLRDPRAAALPIAAAIAGVAIPPWCLWPSTATPAARYCRAGRSRPPPTSPSPSPSSL
jgi:NhaA family Na+:H+ antiporter